MENYAFILTVFGRMINFVEVFVGDDIIRVKLENLFVSLLGFFDFSGADLSAGKTI